MPYSKKTWQDRVVQYPNRFTQTVVSGSVYDLVPTPGTVTQAGTPISAAELNRIENQLEEVYNHKRLTKDTGYALNFTDFNNILDSGMYIGNNLANAPESQVAYFRVFVIANSSTSCTQIAYKSDSVFYVRSCNGGTWTSWVKYDNADTGWITATLLNGVQIFAAGTDLQYRRIGNVVHVRGQLKNITGSVTVATLPSGFRPSGQSVSIAMPSSSDSGPIATFSRWNIGTDGTILFEAKSGTTQTAATWFPLRASFLID